MERTWKTITVLPARDDTAPWIEDEEWTGCLRLILERMPENQRRWLVALLSLQLGHGGIRRLANVAEMDETTIRTGRAELANELQDCAPGRVRREGAGRKPLTETDPTLERDFEELIRDDIAGDPGSGDTWVRRTLREIQKALQRQGHSISHMTVRDLLKKRGIRCRPTESGSRARPTRTATRSSTTSRRSGRSS
jgi:hypothetical protein